MEKINENPARVLLTKTEKKGLFSKKEITMYAVGDENGNPLSDYVFSKICPYEDGFADATSKKGVHVLLDTDGQVVLFPSYEACRVYAKNGYLTIFQPGNQISDAAVMDSIWPDPDSAERNNNVSFGPRGLGIVENQQKKILVSPDDANFLKVFGDIVLYGKIYGLNPYGEGILDSSDKLGIGILSGYYLKSVLPCRYNHVEYLWDRVVAVGRVIVTNKKEVGLLSDKIRTTHQVGFRLFDVDKGWVNDLVFGQIMRLNDSTFSATLFPHIRPEDLTHRQTGKEAFRGKGLLDFRDPTPVVLNDRYEIVPDAKISLELRGLFAAENNSD